MTEERAHAKNNASVYVAVAAIIVAFVAVGYAALQGGEFAKKIAASEQKQSEVLAKLSAFDVKLAAFEKQLAVRLAELEVDLTVYYDSDCSFCDNEKLFRVLDGIEPDMKSKGITLKRVDVRSTR
ncbi:MAG: hypothetical protein QW343_04210, partial [Candidatus Norongarragalinales archaeon]